MKQPAVVRARRVRGGVTLVEILVAVVMLTVAVGGLLIALGGIVALIGRMFRRAKKPAKNKWQAT